MGGIRPASWAPAGPRRLPVPAWSLADCALPPEAGLTTG